MDDSGDLVGALPVAVVTAQPVAGDLFEVGQGLTDRPLVRGPHRRDSPWVAEREQQADGLGGGERQIDPGAPGIDPSAQVAQRGSQQVRGVGGGRGVDGVGVQPGRGGGPDRGYQRGGRDPGPRVRTANLTNQGLAVGADPGQEPAQDLFTRHVEVTGQSQGPCAGPDPAPAPFTCAGVVVHGAAGQSS